MANEVLHAGQSRVRQQNSFECAKGKQTADRGADRPVSNFILSKSKEPKKHKIEQEYCQEKQQIRSNEFH